jgi:hypothetical protein
MHAELLRPPYDELVAAWKSLRARHRGLSVREVATVGAARTLLVAELLPDGGKESSRATIAIAAGVHGDEPAGPWALLSLVESGLLDPAYTYRMWPCTNPSGYRLGTRENEDGKDINRSFSRGGTTPEAKAIVTANRDRKFALSIDIHEDFEADGFYLYEPLVDGKASFGEHVVRALDDASFPIQDLHAEFDFVYPQSSDQRLSRVERGCVFTHPESEMAFTAGLPYNVFQLKHAAKRVLTFESPRKRDWNDRIAIHRIAVTTAISRLALLEG